MMRLQRGVVEVAEVKMVIHRGMATGKTITEIKNH